MLNSGVTEIIYIGDLAYTHSGTAFLVEDDASYVHACHLLKVSCEQTQAILIMVRKKNHSLWLRDFANQIDCPFQYQEKTARLLLADIWNVSLPEWLTDEDVINLNLLDLKVDNSNLSSFESRFLAHEIDPVFNIESISASDIVPFVRGLVSPAADAAFEKYPLLKRCLQSKCQWWAEKSSATWLKELCYRLHNDYKRVWHWLSIWSVLYGYPHKLLEYLLAPSQVEFIDSIPEGAVSGLSLEPTAREQVITQLDLYFKEIRPEVNTSDQFRKVLGYTSGRLVQEYQHLETLLKSGQFETVEADIELFREKFAYCPGVSESQLKLLSRYVKPNRPTIFEKEEEVNAQGWINWTVKEYMPYRVWQVHNNYFDEEVEKTVELFSDWYINEYMTIQKDPDLSIVYSLKRDMISSSELELTIILLIDCLPLSYFDLIDQALRNAGLNQHHMHCRYAALPTVTAINKAALLAGEFQMHGGEYESILKQRADSDWSGKNVFYLSNLKALAEFNLPEGPAVVVLNYLDGDEMLHADLESKNTTYEEELHRLYSRVAEEVNRLAQKWAGPQELFNIIVVTDHGACRILDDEKKSFDSKVVKKLFPNEKHRFASVDAGKVNEVPQNIWALGFRFKEPFISNESVYFLPKGHNTVRDAGAAKGHMHGGVTPEEVIVPVALYKLAKTVWKKLFVRFLEIDLVQASGRAKFFIQRVVTIKIELQNPNTVDIKILRAAITAPAAELKEWEAISVTAGGKETLKLDCYFKKESLGEKELEIEVVYELGGEKHTQVVKLESEFKSAVSGGFSLRDL